MAEDNKKGLLKANPYYIITLIFFRGINWSKISKNLLESNFLNGKRVRALVDLRVTGYDRALFELLSMNVELGTSVQERLAKAVSTLSQGSPVPEDWWAMDTCIDQGRDRVVKRCFEIMSLQQLRDKDLRWILGCQRIAQELERIADYACDLAELSKLKPVQDWPVEILQMGQNLLVMFDGALSMLAAETENSVDLNLQDDALDQVYAALRQELVGGAAQRNTELGIALVTARTLERMGDHVVNVGKALAGIK